MSGVWSLVLLEHCVGLETSPPPPSPLLHKGPFVGLQKASVPMCQQCSLSREGLEEMAFLFPTICS